MTKSKSYLEEILAVELKFHNLPFEREYCFHPKRKWRFDFADPKMKLAVEVEGGTYAQGHHNRAQGYEDDCEKYNSATLHGWRVLRFTSRMVRNRTAGNLILAAYEVLEEPTNTVKDRQ